MDASMLLFGLAILAGPVVMVLLVLFALRPGTRYFAIALALGGISGLVAVAAGSRDAPLRMFLGGFTVLAAPAGIVCALVASMDSIEKRAPNRFQKAFGLLFALVAILLAGAELDRPAGDPVPLKGDLRNLSVVMRQDGVLEQHVTVALADGREVEGVVARGTSVAPFERDLRVNEYRSLITGRRSYQVVGASPSGR